MLIIIPFLFEIGCGFEFLRRISKYFQTTALTYENGALRVCQMNEIKFLDVIAMQTITPSILIARYLKEIQLFSKSFLVEIQIIEISFST